MKPVEMILGKRPKHHHEACFSICPVWQYDLAAAKIQFSLVTVRIDEVMRCGDSKAGPERMVKLTRKLHEYNDKIRELEQ